MIVHYLRHRALEVVAAHPSGGRLGTAALDQAPAQIGGERLGVAIGRSHATVNPAAGRGAPVGSSKPGRNRLGGWMAEIEVQQADITKLDVDAIANAANTALKHGGGVAGAIARAGGRIVQEESDALAPVGLGEAVATSAGEMPASWVIHAATMHLGGPTSAEIIRVATVSTLAKADELGAIRWGWSPSAPALAAFPSTRRRASRSRRSDATCRRGAAWSGSCSPSSAPTLAGRSRTRSRTSSALAVVPNHLRQ